MGERTCILLENDGILLYAHWNTREDMREVVKAALIRGRERWDDPSYLNRIIFSQLIADDVMGLTNYGLMTKKPKVFGDWEIVVTVDVKAQTVDGMSFEKFCLPDDWKPSKDKDKDDDEDD